MQGKYFEEVQVGDTFESQGRTITETDIVMYNHVMWVTNPLHADKEFMKTTPFGGMVAPAPFTLGATLGLMATTGWMAGTALGLLEYQSLKFPAPVRVNDTLHATSEVVAKKETSKPDRGVLTVRDRAFNQRGEVVYDGIRVVLFKRRPA